MHVQCPFNVRNNQHLVGLNLINSLQNKEQHYEEYLRMVKMNLTSDQISRLDYVYPIEFMGDQDRMLQWNKIAMRSSEYAYGQKLDLFLFDTIILNCQNLRKLIRDAQFLVNELDNQYSDLFIVMKNDQDFPRDALKYINKIFSRNEIDLSLKRIFDIAIYVDIKPDQLRKFLYNFAYDHEMFKKQLEMMQSPVYDIFCQDLASSGIGRGANPNGPSILGKRRGGPDEELINQSSMMSSANLGGVSLGDDDFNLRPGNIPTERQTKRVYENQNSFANFMIKKGDMINQLLEEKSAFAYKSEEWLEKKEKQKRFQSKHTKNLKQICGNDPYGEQLGSYQSIDGGISVKKPNKYCDFTGFHTNYQDPKTALRYYNNDFYPVVKNIPEGVKNEYLAIRKANVILR
eukprot:403346492